MQEVQLYINGERVELFQDESISLTQTIQNVRDISKIFTDFTKQFNLPASKTNNKIFKHYYNYDIINGFDARFKVDALIKLNGFDFRKGKIRLNSVSLKDNVVDSYKVVFFGDTVTLTDLLGSDELSTLNLSAYNHAYNSATVKTGFETGLLSNAIRYPFISHTNQFIYDTTGFHNIADTSGIAYTDLKPALLCAKIIDAIEVKYGITFSADFFNSAEFLETYLWLHREKGIVTSGSQTQTLILDLYDWIYTAGGDGDLRPIVTFDNKLFTSIWTVTPTGTGNYDMYIIDRTSGDTVGSSMNVSGVQVLTASVTSSDVRNWDLYYKIETSGGITQVQTDLTLRDYTVSPSLLSQYTSPNANETMVGNLIVSDQMPKMKIIDFLNNLWKMFNLTAYLEDGVVVVKTLDNFYSTGIERDITKYIDVENSDIDRALQYKEIDFKFSEPKTFLTLKGNEISNFEFGNLNYKGDDDFDGGKYEINVSFEKAQYERQLNQTDLTLTQLQWLWFVDSSQKPTIGNPLLFINQNLSCATTQIKWSDSTLISTYNAPCNVNAAGTQTINFGSEIDEYTGTLNTNSLFENYYKNYITSLYNIRARIFKCTAYLPLSILLKYKLNDRFIINNKKYKINSITTDLQSGKSELELITDL